MQYPLAHTCLRSRLSFSLAYPFLVHGTRPPSHHGGSPQHLDSHLYLGLVCCRRCSAVLLSIRNPSSSPFTAFQPMVPEHCWCTASTQLVAVLLERGESSHLCLPFACATTMGHSLLVLLAGQAGLEWMESRTRGWATTHSGTTPQLLSIFKSPRRDLSSSCRQVR